MSVFATISVSLDGFVAGPDPTREEPLGKGGEHLHEWALATAAWREAHGQSGGEDGPDSDVIAQDVGRAGATIMGRRMFSGGEGPWEQDPMAGGWWGETPPFGHPVFVLTHHPREPLALTGTTFTFVTDGIGSALEQAREAAGGKDVAVSGGGEAIQQVLAAGQLDELHLHVAPVLLGGGTPLFGPATAGLRLEPVEVRPSPRATHVRYRVSRSG